MTSQKSFKRLVRARMDKTGESYTAARAMLLAAERRRAGRAARRSRPRTPRSASAPGAAGRSGSTCSTSGARPSCSHRRSRAGSPAELGIHPLAWNAQAITASYERARGPARRSASARTASRSRRPRPWRCRSSGSTTRSSTRRRGSAGCRGRAARADGDAAAARALRLGRRRGSRVLVTFTAKGDGQSTVACQHERLADAAEAERMKTLWRERVGGAQGVAGRLEVGDQPAAVAALEPHLALDRRRRRRRQSAGRERSRPHARRRPAPRSTSA